MNLKEYIDNAIDLEKIKKSDIFFYKTNQEEEKYFFTFYKINFENYYKEYQNDFTYKIISKLTDYIYDKNLEKCLYIKYSTLEKIYDYLSDFVFDFFNAEKYTKKILFEFEIKINKDKKFYEIINDYFNIETNLDAFIYEKTKDLSFFINGEYSLFFKYNFHDMLNEHILEIDDWYLKNSKNEILKGDFKIKIEKETLFNYKIKKIKSKNTKKAVDYIKEKDIFQEGRIENEFVRSKNYIL